MHALPVLLIAVLTILWRDAIDIALVLIFVSYAIAILLLVQPGTDGLRLAALDGAGPRITPFSLLRVPCFFRPSETRFR